MGKLNILEVVIEETPLIDIFEENPITTITIKKEYLSSFVSSLRWLEQEEIEEVEDPAIVSLIGNKTFIFRAVK
jgi:hypothetical protein